MADHVKQHTLPRFYISGFHADRKPSKNPQVWYCPLNGSEARTWSLRYAQDISVRNDYYTLPGLTDKRRLALEKLFGSMETAGAEPLRKLAKGIASKIYALAVFIGSLQARPPRLVEGYGRFLTKMLDLPETSYPCRARNRPDTARLSADMLQETLDVFVPRLETMTWCVYQATGRDRFISSDAPVVVGLPGKGELGLADPKLEILFPLTQSAGLLLCRQRQGLEVRVGPAPPGLVQDFNEGVATNAAKSGTLLIAPEIPKGLSLP